MFYECYEDMALKEMHKLAELAMKTYSLEGISIYHRIGEVVSYLIFNCIAIV